jgi:hypothetical protein
MKRTFILTSFASIAVIILSLVWIFSHDFFGKNDSLKERGKTSAEKGIQSVSKSDSTVSARVSVLNGCGRPGIATNFVRKLRKAGFDVVNGIGENADSFEFDVSLVIDRHGDRKKAAAVAQTLGIKEILDQRAESPFIIEDVVVVIGRDWNALDIPMGENQIE